MRTRGTLLALAMTGLLMLPAGAWAHTAGKHHAGAKQYGHGGDSNFVKKAAETNLAEIDMAKLAADHAQSDQVKQFADRMVRDHTQANDELSQAAQKSGATVPSEPNAKQKAEADKLAKLNGAAFDHAYMQAQVKGHHEAMALLSGYAKTGKDADLKAWAQKTLPTVKDHGREAQQIASAVGGSKSRHASAKKHRSARHASAT